MRGFFALLMLLVLSTPARAGSSEPGAVITVPAHVDLNTPFVVSITLTGPTTFIASITYDAGTFESRDFVSAYPPGCCDTSGRFRIPSGTEAAMSWTIVATAEGTHRLIVGGREFTIDVGPEPHRVYLPLTSN